MQAQVIDQGRIQGRIPECNIFQFYIAFQFLINFSFIQFLRADIHRIFHDILHPLHVGPHFLDGFRRIDDRSRRRHESHQKPLESHDHAQ